MCLMLEGRDVCEPRRLTYLGCNGYTLLSLKRISQEVITTDKCPEINGYNTKLCRGQGHYLAPKTKVVYLPIIEKPPAHAATTMPAMVKAKQISEAANLSFTILKLD